MSVVQQIGREEDPAKRLRKAWGSAIREARTLRGWTIDELAAAIAAASDGRISITPQAVGMWERGETAPRPHHQVLTSRVLGIPHRVLFAITEDAA